MTVHKVKGLEFNVVFVCGIVEGIIVLKNGDLEEERRICFLGISRFKKILFFHTHFLS